MNNGAGYSEVLEQQNVEIGLDGTIKSSAATPLVAKLLRAKLGKGNSSGERANSRQEARGCAELAVNVPKRASK